MLATSLLAWLVLIAEAQGQPNAQCRISGTISSSGHPLPGVALKASMPGGAELAVSSTDGDGTYVLALPAPGAYVLEADLAGFAAATHELSLPADPCDRRIDFSMLLRSRAPTPAAASSTSQAPAAQPGAGPGSARAASPDGRFQNLGVVPGSPETATGGDAPSEPDAASRLLLPPGFTPDAPAESVTMAGGEGRTFGGLFSRDRFDALDALGGDLDAVARRLGGLDAVDGSRGPREGGGGSGRGGDGGGRGFGGGMGGFRRGDRSRRTCPSPTCAARR